MKALNRIKAVLADHNVTGKMLAELLDVSPITVSKWCTNSNQPNLETLNRIADLLNVDVKELIASNQPAANIKAARPTKS